VLLGAAQDPEVGAKGWFISTPRETQEADEGAEVYVSTCDPELSSEHEAGLPEQAGLKTQAGGVESYAELPCQ